MTTSRSGFLPQIVFAVLTFFVNLKAPAGMTTCRSGLFLEEFFGRIWDEMEDLEAF